MSKTEDKAPSRRDFLKIAPAAGVAAAVAATSGTQAEAAVQGVQTGSEARLQDTKHIRAYYESARF